MEKKLKILAAKYVLASALDSPDEKALLRKFAKVRRVYFGNLDFRFPCYWTSAVSIIGGNPWGTFEEARLAAEKVLNENP